MNTRLKELYDEDIADRSSTEDVEHKDAARLIEVEEILNSETDLEAIDYHHAALIFQHGETLEHYEKAYELARKAVDLGDETARWLTAAARDRSLLMSGKAQMYGTQFLKDKDGEWELAQPIDPSVTDKERAKWNVPPLKDALEVYKRKYSL